ncbi:hypothetical protein [Novosphingobium naphthalenivorans]|uniref:hypothetical protein n=1 Tax=Novosphingobium naphthalenivorans TaxID=273168 RepID=UPI00082AA4C5|nr:hypothetical protein [Novosphingobium naphthalenivorans]
MTITDPSNHDAMLQRASSQLAELASTRTRLLMPSLTAIGCAIGIVAACCAEFYSSGVGFHAAFPMKSDGTSLAAELASLRYPIILALLFGDIMLFAFPNKLKAMLDGLLSMFGVGVILTLMAGIGAFMFAATFLTLGSGDGQGAIGSVLGVALGAASAAMFSLSFLASHAMLGKLFAVMPVIATGWGERQHIAAGKALLRDVHDRQQRIVRYRSIVTDAEVPDALARKAANEAGVIVGMVMADAHDLVDSGAARGDAELGPDDRSDVPDVPQAALEKRLADLETYTADYFFNLLTKEPRHA